MTQNVYIVVKDLQGNRGVVAQDALAQDEYVRVALEDGQGVLVARNLLQTQPDETLLFAADFSALQDVDTVIPTANPSETASFPVIVEEAHIEKAWHDIATVKVAKRTVERDVVVEDLLRQETVEIERVSVNKLVEAMPANRTEGDVVIIPVVEEVVVVEKRLMLKEEIHVRRTASQKRFEQTVTLREEQVEINRTEQTNSGSGASQIKF